MCGGVDSDPTCATYDTEKSCVNSAYHMTALAPTSARTLTWLDHVSVAAGALVLFLVVVLANQLIANRPRLARLRVRTA